MIKSRTAIRYVLVLALILAGSAQAARADPISAVLAAIAAFGPIAGGITLGTIAINLAVGAALPAGGTYRSQNGHMPGR